MKRKGTSYSIVLSGLLVALSIVLTRVFSNDLLIAGVKASRLGIGFVPILLAGILCGPYWGFAVGAVADVVGFLLFPAGIYFLPITLTSALAGMLPGLVMAVKIRMPYWLRVFIGVFLVQTLLSMLLQTYWISLLYHMDFAVFFLPRAIVAAVLIPIYFILVYAILLALKRARLLPPVREKA